MGRKFFQSSVSELRNASEAELARSMTGTVNALSAEELLHELRVHQIELEMQNEELRLTHVSLEEGRDRYVDLYDFAPCGYLTLSDTGLITEINLTGAVLFGEERPRLSKRRFARFIADDEKERWYRFFLDAMKSDSKKSCELAMQSSDGKPFYARLDCIRLIKAGSAPQLRISIFDQTEIKRLQLKIEAPMRRYQALMKTSLEGIHIMDMQGNLVEANDAFCRMLGYSREEVAALNVVDWSTEYSAHEFLAQLKDHIGKSVMIETVHRRKDGMLLDVEMSATGEEIEGQALIFCSSRDITDRKRTQESLHISEQKFRTLVENAPDIIMRYDLECRRIYVNPAFENESMIMEDESEYLDPSGRWGHFLTMPVEKYKEDLRRVMETGIASDTVVGLFQREKAGTQDEFRYYSMRIVAERDAEGRVTGALAMGHNITELRIAKQIIEESRTELRGLAARNESLREEERKHIAREVHDELGQILTGLQMNVSMLSSTYGLDLPALREHLQDTLGLVNKSLAVARNVAASLRPSSLDMGIVSAIEWLAQNFTKNTGINCETHVPVENRDIPLGENASNALFRITQESLTNIVRHAKASKVDIKLGQQGSDYLLEVRDNGCGFDSGTIKEGAFGLVGIRERVISLGGELSINSAAGKGTVIEVRIQAQNV